jgi:hypothetical protein
MFLASDRAIQSYSKLIGLFVSLLTLPLACRRSRSRCRGDPLLLRRRHDAGLRRRLIIWTWHSRILSRAVCWNHLNTLSSSIRILTHTAGQFCKCRPHLIWFVRDDERSLDHMACNQHASNQLQQICRHSTGQQQSDFDW